MASIAIMIGGAILNATAFIGGSYMAKALGSDSGRLEEQKRHDKALEKYQTDYAAWNRKRQQYTDWLSKNYQNKVHADENFKNTDYALKLYAQAHPKVGPRPVFNYEPSKRQENHELLYVGVGGLAIGGAAAYFL
jgi:hypothetical protein